MCKWIWSTFVRRIQLYVCTQLTFKSNFSLTTKMGQENGMMK